MKHLKYSFIENKASGMVVFRGGGVSALVPSELKFEALSVLYAYANCEKAKEFAHEIFREPFDNPFFGMPEDELVSLALALKSEIAVPWRYNDLDIESNFSAVVNYREPDGCTPVVTVKGTNAASHLAILAAFSKITSLRAKLETYDSKSVVLLYRTEKNIPFFGFDSLLDVESKYVQTLILRRSPPLSFIFAIPSSYDLWSSMHDNSKLPRVKLLDFCAHIPVALTRAVIAQSSAIAAKPLTMTRKSNDWFKDVVANSGQVMTTEDLAVAVAA